MDTPRGLLTHLLKDLDGAPLVQVQTHPLQATLTTLCNIIMTMREEQANTRASLNDMWGRLDHIDSRVNDAYTLVDGTRADLGNVAKVDAVEGIAERLASLYEVMHALPTTKQVEEMQRDVATLRGVIEAHAGDIAKCVPQRVFSGVADEVTSIRHTLEKLPAPQALLESLDRVASNEASLKALRKDQQDDMAGVRDRLIQADTQTRKNIQQRHDESTEQALQVSRQCQELIRKQFKEEDAKYDEICADISHLKDHSSAIAMLHARVQTVETSTSAARELEKYQQRTSERVSVIETEVPRMRDELVKLHDASHSSAVLRPLMLDHVKEVDALRAELSEVRGTMHNVVGQVTTLSDHVAGLEPPTRGHQQRGSDERPILAQLSLLSERLHEVEKSHRVMDVRQGSTSMNVLQMNDFDERLHGVEKEIRSVTAKVGATNNDSQVRANTSHLQSLEEHIGEADKQIRSLALRQTTTLSSLEAQIKSTSSHVADFIDRVIDLEKHASAAVIHSSVASGAATDNVQRAMEPFMASLRAIDTQVATLSRQQRLSPPDDDASLLYRVFDIDAATARLASQSDISERVRFVHELPSFKALLRIVYNNTSSAAPKVSPSPPIVYDMPSPSVLSAATPSFPKVGLEIVDTDGRGVKIINVRSDAAAYASGLRIGDVIVQFNGSSVVDKKSFVSALGQCKPFAVVTVLYVPAGQTDVVGANIRLGAPEK